MPIYGCPKLAIHVKRAGYLPPWGWQLCRIIGGSFADVKYANNMSDELNLHHAGKFVLIYNSNFVASYDSFDNAAKDAVKKFGRGPYLIRQVGAPTEMPMPASVAYRPIYAHN